MQHIEVMSLYHRTEPSREFKQSAEYEPLRAMTQYMGPGYRKAVSFAWVASGEKH
jgi:hypothetical protein